MNTEYMNIALDLIVLAGLGFFFFFALKLSSALNAFRAHRDEFGKTMTQLDQTIQEAKASLAGLKTSSREANKDLENLVDEAKALIDDLQVVNSVGDGLAKRLEGLIEKGRKHANEAYDDSFGGNVSSLASAKASRKGPLDDGFVIHDPDFGDNMLEDDLMGDNDVGFENDPDMDNLASEAEKELYKALKSKKKQ